MLAGKLLKKRVGEKSSPPGRKEEFTVEQVEAAIATLSDKVARLREDIGTLKRTPPGTTTTTLGSHRRRVPNELTYAKNAREHDEKKAATLSKGINGSSRRRRERESRESKSFSHEPSPSANSREPLSCRVETTSSNASTDTTTTTTQRKHALFNAQRKNRPTLLQPSQEVNSRADDRQNTLYPNASDFAPTAYATPPHPEARNASCRTRKALRKRISRGIQYDTHDCQVTKYHVRMTCFPLKKSDIQEDPMKHRRTQSSLGKSETSSGTKARRSETTELQQDGGGARSIDNKRRDRASAKRNMDEHRTSRTGVSWRGIDDEQRGGQDARRYDVDERNRPPVAVKPVTTPPHRRSNPNEATGDPSAHSDKRLDRLDSRRDELATTTAAPKSTDEKFINDRKHADKVENKSTKKLTSATKDKLVPTSTKEKADDITIATAKKNKKEESNANDKKDKSLKLKKDKSSKAVKIKDNKLSSKLKSLSKIKIMRKEQPENNKSNEKNGNLIKRKSDSIKKGEKHSESQKMKNNTKSSDSIEPQYVLIKNKLNKCTKELNQLVGKISDLFRKKSSKSK